MNTYFYRKDSSSEPQGPFSAAKMERLRAKGILTPDMLVTVQKDGDWKPVSQEKSIRLYPHPRYITVLLLVLANWFVYYWSLDGNMMDGNRPHDFTASYWACMTENEWWRCLSTIFTAANLPQLIITTVLLLVFAPLVVPVMGMAGFLLCYLMSGLAGTMAALIEVGSLTIADRTMYFGLLGTEIDGILAATAGVSAAALIIGGLRRRFHLRIFVWVAIFGLLGLWTYKNWNTPLLIMATGFVAGLLFAAPSAIRQYRLVRQEPGTTHIRFRRTMQNQWHLVVSLFVLAAAGLASYLIAGNKTAIYAYNLAKYKSFPKNDKNPEQVFRLMQYAAEQGYPLACETMGFYFNSGEYPVNEKASAQWFEKAARYGLPEAQYRMAIAYKEGKGTDQNNDKARFWLECAANQNHEEAMFNLAIAYLSGHMGRKDAVQGAALLKRLVERDKLIPPSSEATYILGTLYERGEGMGKNPEKAFQLYENASEQGEMNAMLKVAQCHLEGRGTEKNEHKAQEWLFKAGNAYRDKTNALLRLAQTENRPSVENAACHPEAEKEQLPSGQIDQPQKTPDLEQPVETNTPPPVPQQ